MNKIRTGDNVVVIAGREKGKSGVVKKVIMGKDRRPQKVVVEGLNLVFKHVKVNPDTQEGGIKRFEAPLDASNIALLNPATQKADRVGIKTVNGEKKRYFKSNGEVIDIGK